MKHEITFYHSYRSQTQFGMFTRAAKGLKKLGVKAHVTSEKANVTQNVACWGWRNGQTFRAEGKNVLVFERGYIGDRHHFTSLGWNGLNNRADFCLPPTVDSSRFDKFGFKLEPWKKEGKIIIMMGQVIGDMSLQGLNLTDFYNNKANELRKFYKKEVYFRPHPVGLEKNRNFRPSVPHLGGDLKDALREAHLVLTFNSNAGVDAVVNGIPALSFDKGSMAYSVTGHSVGDRITPEREQWAYQLAHCQWTPEEIQNGDYWERMKCRLEN